jgi:hypothetical protein
MRRWYTENVLVLCLALAIAVTAVVFPNSGRILRLGGGLGFAALFVIKGARRLQCRWSDVWLTAAALVLVLVSKLIPSTTTNPLLLEIVALAFAAIFLATGRTVRRVEHP